MRPRSARSSKYGTVLEAPGGGTIQSCCPCFGSVSKGACAGHYAELYWRYQAGLIAFAAACGWALQLGMESAHE